MEQNPSVCQNCGALLAPGASFCEQCGAPAGQPVMPAQPVAPAQPPIQPQTPATVQPQPQPPAGDVYTGQTLPPSTKPRRSRTCLIAALVVAALCVCLVAGGLVAILMVKPRVSQIFRDIGAGSNSATEPTQTEPASNLPQTEEPTPGPATGSDLTSYFDDFSDPKSRWEVGSNEVAAWGYENGAYFIQIKNKQTIYWVLAPTQLEATDLEFDASPAENYPDSNFGTYGAVCHYFDKDNFYFIETDPSTKAVYFGKYSQGTLVTLSNPEWIDAKNFKPTSGEVNHIRVSCTGSVISLSINGQFETEVTDEGTPTGGSTGVFGATYDGLPPGGFKVFFDNFSAWVPTQ